MNVKKSSSMGVYFNLVRTVLVSIQKKTEKAEGGK